MKKWLGNHPKTALYSITALVFLFAVSCILNSYLVKQLRLTGAAGKEQYFILCRSHAEDGLALLAEDNTGAAAAHSLLSAAEYLQLCGEEGVDAAQILKQGGETILNGGVPENTVTEILRDLANGRITYIPPEVQETETAEVMWNPWSLTHAARFQLAGQCTGVPRALREVWMPETDKCCGYVCRNLYLVLSMRGYPLEYAVYFPYREMRYGENECREAALRWVHSNMPQDILGREALITDCTTEREGYRMTLRCKSGMMEIFVRNDNGMVDWFSGRMLEI